MPQRHLASCLAALLGAAGCNNATPPGPGDRPTTRPVASPVRGVESPTNAIPAPPPSKPEPDKKVQPETKAAPEKKTDPPKKPDFQVGERELPG
jgi:hypothetical protein